MQRFIFLSLLAAVILTGQDAPPPQLPVSDPSCVFFGSQQARYFSESAATNRNFQKLSRLTKLVSEQLAPAPGGGRTASSNNLASSKYLIDQYLFSAMQSAGVQPADTTTDWEFVRRIYFDLTGRIPTAAQTLAFVSQ